ncbi:hypothetical protein SESBI_04175 [Sesbania bispinosa]|nr:hypothetical protein SESBI_04175 [Sesbania bispinosa]
MGKLNPSPTRYVLSFLSLQRLSRRVLMEDYPPQEQRRDVSASFLYEPGFGIVSKKPLPVKPSKPWPDQDHVNIKKALRGLGDPNHICLLKEAMSDQRYEVTIEAI